MKIFSKIILTFLAGIMFFAPVLNAYQVKVEPDGKGGYIMYRKYTPTEKTFLTLIGISAGMVIFWPIISPMIESALRAGIVLGYGISLYVVMIIMQLLSKKGVIK